MCGIAGIVGQGGPDERVLARMAAVMAHRGPDGQDVWQDGTCGLAFRRLAIIDLDERSMQPMHLGSLHLVFNGEVYNYRELRSELEGRGHRFRTEGDTEVLLHAWDEWGEAAVERVNGMFAVGVWNDRERSLTLAVDRFGEKPLLYRQGPDGLAFGSDVRALREVAPLESPDEEAVGRFVALGFMPPTDASFFAGVARVPAAHLVTWRDGRLSRRRYWTPRAVDVPDTPEEAAEVLRGLLVDSIRLRLRSDVPVGTSLSGGVDSSTIVALSASIAGDHRRHAFTATFPGFELDEWELAHEVAQAAGVEQHHAVRPDAEGVLAEVEHLVAAQEEPFGTLSIYAQWRVMRAAREAGIVVLLDGQGADELLGGYPPSIGFAVRSMGPGAVARAVLGEPRVRGLTVRAMGAGHLPGWAARAYRRRTSSAYVLGDVVARAAQHGPGRPEPWMLEHGPLPRELLVQSFSSSLPELLRYADRDSMANSVEVRLPFLDPRVAEYCLSLPAGLVYREGQTKRVLRDAVRDVVPASILGRREKVGFEPPQERWLATPAARDWIADVLLGGDAPGYLDPQVVEADVRAGAWRDSRAIWRAVSAVLWERAFFPPTRAGERPDRVAA